MNILNENTRPEDLVTDFEGLTVASVRKNAKPGVFVVTFNGSVNHPEKDLYDFDYNPDGTHLYYPGRMPKLSLKSDRITLTFTKDEAGVLANIIGNGVCGDNRHVTTLWQKLSAVIDMDTLNPDVFKDDRHLLYVHNRPTFKSPRTTKGTIDGVAIVVTRNPNGSVAKVEQEFAK